VSAPAQRLLLCSGVAAETAEALRRRATSPNRDAVTREADASEEDTMKAMRVLYLTLTLAALTATMAFAQTATPRIERREARQDARIHQGVRTGELTRGEAHRLRAGERHIDRMEARAKSDGVVTPRERARINRAQTQESRRIHRLKHNNIMR
jgi:hypothetical protein